nr:hypothetical protein [Tanacetum cinerariifolium]
MIDDEEVLQAREKFMKDIQTFLQKFSRYPFGVMPKVLSIDWERFSEINDDESLSNEDVPIENFKVYSNPLFDDEEINSDKLDPHCFNAEYDLIESLSNQDTLIDSSSKFDYLEEFSGELMPSSIVNEEQIADTIVESLSLSPVPVEDGDYLMDKIDLFLSSNFDHHNDPSFPRPPSKPPDVEFFFDLEPDLISVVINNIDELIEDECFDPGGEINVFANVEDDDYFPFIFVIQFFLPYLICPEVFALLLSAGSEDTIFDPGIS